MARTRDPDMRKSDWNTWTAGSRGVEVERPGTGTGGVACQRAQSPPRGRRDKGTFRAPPRREQEVHPHAVGQEEAATEEPPDLCGPARYRRRTGRGRRPRGCRRARLEDTRREPRLAGGCVLGGRRGDVALHRGLAPTRCCPRRFCEGVPPDELHAG